MMLYILGKEVSNGAIQGYRVADIAFKSLVPMIGQVGNNTIEKGVESFMVRTLDIYQILQLLYAEVDGKYYRFINARLGYKLNSNSNITYYLNSPKRWVFDGDRSHKPDEKYIPAYNIITLSNLVVDAMDSKTLDSYGNYGEKISPYVILAEYVSDANVTMGYLVANANVSALNQVDALSVNKLVDRVKLFEKHTGKKGLANAYLREVNGKYIIVPKVKYNEIDSFITVHVGKGANYYTDISGKRVSGKPKLKSAFDNDMNNVDLTGMVKEVASEEDLYSIDFSDFTEVKNSRPSMSTVTKSVNNAPVRKPNVTSNRSKLTALPSGNDRVLTIPDELEELVQGQIYKNNLTRLIVHAGVREISPDALLLCEDFNSFVVDKSNQHLCSAGGLLISKNGSTLLRCPPKNKTTMKNIPKGYMKVIGKGAFRGCVNITEMIIPETVERVEAGAFCGAENLQRIVCYAQEIDEDAFVDCPNLREIILGYGVEVIKGTMVRNSPKLKYIVLPDSLKIIESKTYNAIEKGGYSSNSTLHKMIESSGVKYIFAPNSPNASTWVRNLFTDNSMYSTGVKKFSFLVNSSENLAKYNISALEKYIRRL